MKTIITICMFISLGSIGLSAEDTSAFNPDLNYAQVMFVKAVQSSNDSWTFSVTVRHNDEGWNHYADAWEVVDPDSGKVFATRILAHPHETEQPFTRSQSGIIIPKGQQFVEVKAKCTLHGYEGKTVLINLGVDKGDDYQLIKK